MAMPGRLRVVCGEAGLSRGRGAMLPPRGRHAGSESPAHHRSNVELSRGDVRYSHSCTDLTSYISLTTPRDTAHALCSRTRISPSPCPQTPTSPTAGLTQHSPSPSDYGPQLPRAPRTHRPQPRRPVTATVSAPRLATTACKWRDNSRPVRHSPARLTSVVGLGVGVGNGRVGAQEQQGRQGHQRVGAQMSWSPSRQGPPSFRPRVFSDCHTRPSHLSRSFRIKQWIQARQRSSSQNTYVTVDEADDEGRPLGRHLDNICEESDLELRQRKKSRRRLGEFTTSRRKQWLTERGISPSSETSQDNIEKDGNLEERLLEASTSWNAHAIHEHRMNALRSCLTAKNEPLLVLNLLEANKITEAVALARDSKTRVRLDVCLLWACVQGAADLVEMLLEAGASVDARDNSGLSALHLAAEKGADEVLRALLKGGAKVGGHWEWDGNEEFTPLMLAARSGCLEAVRVLIEGGAKPDAGLNTRGETALHQAVRAASPECVQLLIEAGATVNPTLLFSETPLHVAVSEGLTDIVGILLEAGANVRASRGNSKMTPLHIAAQEGYCGVAHQLLKAGANPNQENLRGQTPLHLAAKAQSSDTVQLLLGFGADPNACDRDKKTPLHSGIFKGSRSHECLRLLLEAGADTNAADQSGHTPLHMAALHESSYCVLLFLDHGGDVTACTQGGVSALNVILRRTPTVLAHIQESLDAAISFTDHDHHDRDAQVQMDFRVLVPGEARGLECRMLSCFIREGQKPLLKHPLCETLLFLKWLKVRSFFVLNLIFYALLVIMLTIYIMVVFPSFSCYHLNSTSEETIYPPFQFSPPPPPLNLSLPAKPAASPGHTRRLLDPGGGTQESDTASSQLGGISKRERCGLLYESLLTYLLYAVWTGVSLLAVKEVFQIINAPRTYLSWDNVFIWPIIIFTMTITITSYVRHDTEDWEHHLAAVVILLSWVELLFIIGRFPVFGLYVQMFTHVTRNFGKFLFAYICLINAFSLSFGVLFPNHAPFRTVGLRLLKTLVMMTGEIEYDEWFFDDEKTIMYPSTSYLVFSVFLIFVTIILMNLLVGLAVSDIQGLLKSVGLDRLVRQTQLVVHFETFMFSKWLALVMPGGVLRLLHQSVLLFPSLYGCTFILSPKMLRDTGIPQELVEVIMHTARARDHISRRRNAFANFRSLSKTAQYSSSEGDVHRSVEALRFGLDLLVWDVDERRSDAMFVKESLAALTEEVARVGQCVEELAGRGKEAREASVYTSCSSTPDASRSTTPSLP
ncbi:transient receptor potential channel pyrexia-like [Portunus trituberculatus]|uniref:transient receptor potential channel pyrexia-like n=1 Tax=Portunus trituberculatus TaxID=210409 RepID=UPI001E1CE359|nr:transient receptor potential channel pyrexia-like [Portunus trituberculatus]XP_045116323.1 transient receptor potential channel pyrexia-like [Portunus trituberculatus]